MKTITDVLQSPEIKRHTQRILDLKAKAGQIRSNLANITADIGDELAATKAALDRTPDKTAWLRWLSKHVDFTRQSAANYMRVAKFRKKWKNVFPKFSRLGVAALEEIAGLPARLIRRLGKDPRLDSPETGQLTPIDQMSDREFERALKMFRGKKVPRTSKLPPPDKTADQLAVECIKFLRGPATQSILVVNHGQGKLLSANKAGVLDAVNDLRKIALRLKAWVTPQKGKRRLG